MVLNNPFADVVIGNIGNLYPNQTSESVQIVTRSMAKQNEFDENEQVRLDLKWKSDDFEGVPEKEGNQVHLELLSEIKSREDLITYQNSDKTQKCQKVCKSR